MPRSRGAVSVQNLRHSTRQPAVFSPSSAPAALFCRHVQYNGACSIAAEERISAALRCPIGRLGHGGDSSHTSMEEKTMATPLHRMLVSCLAALVATLACGDRVLAGTTGSISGTVTDGQTGAPISGVAVSATSPSAVQTSTTDAKGFFTIQALPPDTYAVTFSKVGYQTTTAAGVTVLQDQTASTSLAMQPLAKLLGKVPVRA